MAVLIARLGRSLPLDPWGSYTLTAEQWRRIAGIYAQVALAACSATCLLGAALLSGLY